jgi:Zn-dependent protease with chaperone function
MPFLLLLLLTLICLQGQWPNPLGWQSPLPASLLTWACVGLMVAAAGVLARRGAGQLHRHPDQRSSLLRRYAKLRRYHGYSLIAVFLTTLYVVGWGWAVRLVAAGGSPALAAAPLAESRIPGLELLLLAPFLTGLLLSWAAFYTLERAGHDTAPYVSETEPFLSRGAYVLLHARQNLLLIFPPLLLMIIQQIVFWLWPSIQDNDIFLPIFAVVLLGAIFIGIPLVLRVLLGLRPLPAGPLRDRLAATSRRLGFRCNDILLWNTRNAMANAMVTGPLPILRYVVLTDRLVREMAPEEVEAVFGHEIGHIKHHHMLFYFSFLVGSLVVLAGAWEGLKQSVDVHLAAWAPAVNDWLQNSEFLGLLPLVALLASYVFVVFGFLSRRCERQADIYGCRTVSPQVFIDALEKVARLNGISRDRPGWLSSWQHSTIARRVEFLQRMCGDATLEPRFQRRVRIIKWSLVLVLGALILTVYNLLGAEVFLKILRGG